MAANGPRTIVRIPGRGDAVYRVEAASNGRVVVEGSPAAFEVSKAGEGAYRVTDGTRTWHIFVAGPPEAREVFVDGEVYEVEVAHEGRGRRHTTASSHDALAAPMPATVVKVLAVPGQVVRVGEPLIILEAMKMELPVRAPRDGVVRAVHCREGELIQPGVRLIELE